MKKWGTIDLCLKKNVNAELIESFRKHYEANRFHVELVSDFYKFYKRFVFVAHIRSPYPECQSNNNFTPTKIKWVFSRKFGTGCSSVAFWPWEALFSYIYFIALPDAEIKSKRVLNMASACVWQTVNCYGSGERFLFHFRITWPNFTFSFAQKLSHQIQHKKLIRMIWIMETVTKRLKNSPFVPIPNVKRHKGREHNSFAPG